MSAWTQIVVKGGIIEASAALSAHCISPDVVRVIPSAFDHWPGRTHMLVPSEPRYAGRLHEWWFDLVNSPPEGGLLPGTLLWFGAFIANAEHIKSLRRVSDYANLGVPIAQYLSEM